MHFCINCCPHMGQNLDPCFGTKNPGCFYFLASPRGILLYQQVQYLGTVCERSHKKISFSYTINAVQIQYDT